MVFTPSTELESSAIQSTFYFSVPTLNHHLHANAALFATAPHLFVLILDTSLLLLRFHHLHLTIATISSRTSVLLHKRWKLTFMWQRQSFTKLLPARSLPREVGLCFPKLAI